MVEVDTDDFCAVLNDLKHHRQRVQSLLEDANESLMTIRALKDAFRRQGLNSDEIQKIVVDYKKRCEAS